MKTPKSTGMPSLGLETLRWYLKRNELTHDVPGASVTHQCKCWRFTREAEDLDTKPSSTELISNSCVRLGMKLEMPTIINILEYLRLNSTTLLAATVVALGFLLALKALSMKTAFAQRSKGLPLPPGPKGLPILGNLLQIPKVKPWKVYAEWKKQYGDMIYLEALGQRMLVLNSLEDIEALLVKRSTNYSDRPYSATSDLMRQNWVFSMMTYGNEWRERRKAFHQFFHSNARSIQPVVEEEVRDFLKRVCVDRGVGVWEDLRSAFGLILLRVTYGSYPKQPNSEGQDLLTDLLSIAQTLVLAAVEYLNPGRLLVNVLPILRFVPAWFPGAGWKRTLLRLADLTDYLHEKPWEEVLARAKQACKASTQVLLQS
ncbi:cytochrome P450 [Coprinopsis cinerea AmutBmut pab1-1]|nr:cytochrome P450 [Coprinopsis cinerea AmutBmut pab1-1]